VVVLLGAIVAGQNIVLGNQDKEIMCRSEGSDDARECEGYGVAVMRVANLNDYLTIQNQMSKISMLNGDKMLLSRVFGVLDVILPTYEMGDDRIEVTELTVDLPTATLSFDAQGNSKSGIDYRALEVFKNIIKLSYFDHGRYMRYDGESKEFVEIPSFCVDEPAEAIKNGVVYGIYHKGLPGCEALLLAREREDGLDDEEEDEAEQVIDIEIKRTYKTVAEMEKYKAEKNELDGGRYYFESECKIYGDDGVFDEEATRSNCRLAEATPAIRDSSNGRDAGGSLVLRFSATVTLNTEVFRFRNKHMQVIGPTRQNVTDSYTQIRNMFAERAADCDPEDTDCLRQGGTSGN
jgi:hypothetical protein